MAVIDMQKLMIEPVPASEAEVYERLDELCREWFELSAAQFIEAIREDRPVDHPAAARLEVLARAFI
jgi:hypothetical protein